MVRSGEDYNSDWVVLTGGSMTGKTAVANRLALEGYPIVPEVAESYVDHAKSYEIDAEEAQRFGGAGPIPLADIAMEGNHAEDADVILDRSIGDSLYFLNRFHDVEPGDSILVDTLFDYAENQYDEVFWLESVEDETGFEDDGTRTEDRELAEDIHFDLEEWYDDVLGYDVQKIASNPIDERVEDIVDQSNLNTLSSGFQLP